MMILSSSSRSMMWRDISVSPCIHKSRNDPNSTTNYRNNAQTLGYELNIAKGKRVSATEAAEILGVPRYAISRMTVVRRGHPALQTRPQNGPLRTRIAQ
ncbi:hypothetical protein BN2475_240013 [Paraburkholderia ribeironis]|uniref:Uncharacterized protein n=1 Tax=Paraburkholderia ribeironis TaxID=1247936 RepID=A0A1N7RXX5_9BURK|nr:hypothetical protein BN2475_240013 [Paraburkholderia ribeironis]